jgi:hypothetical protein
LRNPLRSSAMRDPSVLRAAYTGLRMPAQTTVRSGDGSGRGSGHPATPPTTSRHGCVAGRRGDGHDPARLCSPSGLASITISVKVRADGSPGDDGAAARRHRLRPTRSRHRPCATSCSPGRAVQQATIYPPGHPNVAIAAQR